LIKDEIISKANIDRKEIIKCRPADILESLLEKKEKEISHLAENIEDTLSYTIFPEVAKNFLEKKYAKKYNLGMEIISGDHYYDEERYGI
jgi:pyruvate/oxaloacetate carboxyltransferase